MGLEDLISATSKMPAARVSEDGSPLPLSEVAKGVSVVAAGGIMGYRQYKVSSASPDYFQGMSVFAKEPLGAALQLYNIYRENHSRPRTVAVIHLERGKKAIRIERHGNELTVYYLKGDPEAAVNRMRKKRKNSGK